MTSNTPTHPNEAAPLLMAIPEVSRCLGVGRTTIYQLIASGELQVVRIGKRSLIPSDNVVNLVDRLKAAGS